MSFIYTATNFFCRLTVSISLLMSGLSAVAEPIDELERIASQPVIRIGVAAATANGHQSASATVVEGLRKLGYRGKIEVIYFEEAKHKLSYLFPQFSSSGPDEQIFAKKNISFVSKGVFDQNPEKYPWAEFGIFGADDMGSWPEELRVQTLLTIQPTKWLLPARLLSMNPDGSLKTRNLPHLYRLAFGVYSDLDAASESVSSDEAGFNERVESMLHSAELASKVPGLEALLGVLNKTDFAAFYGHHEQSGQVWTYAAGLARAMDREPQLFGKGGIVGVLNQSVKGDLYENAKEEFQKRYGSDRVRVVDIFDPNLKAILSKTKPTQITILEIGFVAKPLFEFLFYASTLPPVVEGLNSINLMNRIGKPYLPSSMREGYQRPHAPELAVHASQTLARFYGRLFPNEEQLRALSEFFVQLRMADSKLKEDFESQYFKEKDLRSDRLFRSLKAANIRLRALLRPARSAVSSADKCERILAPTLASEL